MSLAAQPVHPTILKDVDDQEFIAQGITLRQYAAIKIAAALSTRPNADYRYPQDIVNGAIAITDKLIAALEKSP